jgi:RNA polymerase sigma-70 factor (ECF subfamily)
MKRFPVTSPTPSRDGHLPANQDDAELVRSRDRCNVNSANPAADAAMDRYVAGDRSAFEDLYGALAPQLAAFLSRKLGNPTDVADIMQETMLRIHAARGRFARGSWVTPWAFAIARRVFLDRARRAKREHLVFDRDADLDQLAGRIGPEELLSSHRSGQALLRAVSELPPRQRAACELVYFNDLSHAEAAQTLGVTVAGVKLRVHRANRTIRAVCGGRGACGART